MLRRLSVSVFVLVIGVAGSCMGAGSSGAEPAGDPGAAVEVRTEAAPTTAEPSPPTSEPRRLRFSFRYQPWSDVLDWYAEQAGYSLVLDAPPKGTFNYKDDRSYTPAEAMDVLNSVLLTKGYTLVLRGRMLLVVNLEDEIPPSMIARVEPEELDRRGKYELVSTRFELKNLTAEEAQKEIEKLLGPQGRIVLLPKARQIVVTETGGRLREIRDVLRRADLARDPTQQEVRWFNLSSVGPEEAVAMLRQMFEIPEGANTTPDGSLRLATDPIGLRLLASGSPGRLRQVSRMLKTIDQPAFGQAVESGHQAALQLEVYDVAPADPESVLKVMQTLLAETPGVRLATDPKTGNLIALARLNEQATVRATVEQMRHDAQSVEVIQLHVIDPQLAVLAIGKLFGKDSEKAPSVDANVANRQLLIRGSAGQIAQIRTLLEKMGETVGAAPALAGGKLRLVPIRGGDTGQLIDRLRELWPTVGSNKLYVVPRREPDRRGPAGPRAVRPALIDERTPVPGPADETDRPAAPRSQPTDGQPQKPVRLSPQRKVRVTLASTESTVEEGATGPDDIGASSDQQGATGSSSASADQRAGRSTKPPILILVGPDGLYLSSEDTEALDQLQKLIDTLEGGSVSSEPKLTVFYLRNAQAKTVAERLNQLLAPTLPAAATSTTGTGSTPAPTGILGNLGAAGTIGHITPSGPVSITSDERLNALLVQAAPRDVDMIEEVLRVLDRREGPEEIPAQPKPRLIPVVHTSASEIAEVLKEVYQDRLVGSSTRTPTPQEMMMQMFQARRGMRGPMPRDSNARGAQAAVPKMSIGVDTRTNSLVVSAPERLFEEVRELVGALDRVASQDNEMVEVVTLRQSNPEAVREALSSLLGDSVESAGTSGTSRVWPGSTGRRPGTGNQPALMGRPNWRSFWQGPPQPQGRQRSRQPQGSQPGRSGRR